MLGLLSSDEVSIFFHDVSISVDCHQDLVAIFGFISVRLAIWFVNFSVPRLKVIAVWCLELLSFMSLKVSSAYHNECVHYLPYVSESLLAALTRPVLSLFDSRIIRRMIYVYAINKWRNCSNHCCHGEPDCLAGIIMRSKTGTRGGRSIQARQLVFQSYYLRFTNGSSLRSLWGKDVACPMPSFFHWKYSYFPNIILTLLVS